MLGCWKQCGTVWTSVSQRLLCYSLVPQPVPLSGGYELLDGERPTWRVKVVGSCCWRKLLSFVLFFPWTSLKPRDKQVILPWHIALGQLTDMGWQFQSCDRNCCFPLKEPICLEIFVLRTIGQWSQLLGSLLRTVKLKVSGQIHWFSLITAQIWTAQKSWVFKRGFSLHVSIAASSEAKA